MDTKDRLEQFMKKAADRVQAWPDWKRNVGLTDQDRQFERYVPEPERVEPADHPDASQELDRR
ncbi:MAG: hypothetical protein AB1714_01555 [Acidobacteriota bacterium]